MAGKYLRTTDRVMRRVPTATKKWRKTGAMTSRPCSSCNGNCTISYGDEGTYTCTTCHGAGTLEIPEMAVQTIEGEFLVDIDVGGIASLMARRAINNSTGTARLLGGLIRAKATRLERT